MITHNRHKNQDVNQNRKSRGDHSAFNMQKTHSMNNKDFMRIRGGAANIVHNIRNMHNSHNSHTKEQGGKWWVS